jgi:23S rRNA (guanine745-N1)-methyltransferase
MTPYAWKTPKSGVERLKKVERLDVRVEFDLHWYRKV